YQRGSNQVLRIGHEADVAEVTNVVLHRGLFQLQVRDRITWFGQTEEVLAGAKSLREHVIALQLEVMGDPLLRGQHQAVIGRRSVAEVRTDRFKGRVGSFRQVEEAGMRRVGYRQREVCIGFTGEPVPEYALVSDAEHPGGPELTRDGHRSLVNFGVLDGWRNGANAPKRANRMEERQLSGARLVRVHLV